MTYVYFRCACEKCLATDENSAGRTIACPDCGAPLVIPAANTHWKCPHCQDTMAAPTSMVGRTIQCVACRQSSVAPLLSSALRTCETCGAPNQVESLFCTQCGHKLQTAAKLSPINQALQLAHSGRFPARLSMVILAVLITIVLGLAWSTHRYRTDSAMTNLDRNARTSADAGRKLNGEREVEPKANGFGNASQRLRDREQAIADSQALNQDMIMAGQCTNLDAAVKLLQQSLITHALATNRNAAEQLLAAYTIQRHEAGVIADAIQQASLATNKTFAIQIIQSALNQCPKAINCEEAQRLLALYQKQSEDTRNLEQVLALARTTNQTNAILQLQTALSNFPAASNRHEAETLLMQYQVSQGKEIQLQQQAADDSKRLEAVMSSAKNSTDRRLAVQNLETALRQYSKATNLADAEQLKQVLEQAFIPADTNQPVSAADKTVKPATEEAGLALSSFWQQGLKGGSGVLDDMYKIFNPYGQPELDLTPHPSITIYKNVTYLMPLNKALEKLSISNKLSSKNALNNTAFPASSFYYYSYPGRYEGKFNLLLLVTDTSNQIVAIQLVEETPKDQENDWDVSWWVRWKTLNRLFNIIQMRTKASSNVTIFYRIENANGVYKVYTRLVDNSGKSKENVCLYIPQPLVNLVLYRLSKLQQ